jgi:subtilisin family serine protease
VPRRRRRYHRASNMRASAEAHTASQKGLLDLVGLTPLMNQTSGNSAIAIGLIDGPVARDHPDFAGKVRELTPSDDKTACAVRTSFACMHGTFVAGILSAQRGSPAPAICPDCTLLVRPIFSESTTHDTAPGARPEELAAAIIELADAGARLLNVSAALIEVPNAKTERAVRAALDHAAARGVLVVAAAGNMPSIGTSVLTQHPCVVPVVACDRHGRPLYHSNLAHSIALRGRLAPGVDVISLSADGRAVPAGGTSVAAPFVTGALALVWSEFPDACASRVRGALARSAPMRRLTVVPPLLDAWAIYQAMQ